MNLVRNAITGLAVAAFLPTGVASAQSFPVTPGTLEFQLGIAGIVLPEDQNGTFSAQPEVRAGYFVLEGLQLQAEANARVWPLGNQAPKSYGLGAHVLWFPRPFPSRSVYALGGLAVSYLDYADRYQIESGVVPSVRVGGGIKVSLAKGFVRFMRSGHFTVEYRGEWIRLNEDMVVSGRQVDFVSGIALGYSIFR
jgi:hypothetical protein